MPESTAFRLFAGIVRSILVYYPSNVSVAVQT